MQFPLHTELLLAQDIVISEVTNFIALRSYVFNHLSYKCLIYILFLVQRSRILSILLDRQIYLRHELVDLHRIFHEICHYGLGFGVECDQIYAQICLFRFKFLKVDTESLFERSFTHFTLRDKVMSFLLMSTKAIVIGLPDEVIVIQPAVAMSTAGVLTFHRHRIVKSRFFNLLQAVITGVS